MLTESSAALKNDTAMQALTPNTLDSKQKVLRLNDLPSYMGLSKSMISNLRRPKSPYFDPRFPQAIKLSRRAIGFFKHEIDAYLSMRQKQS